MLARLFLWGDADELLRYLAAVFRQLSLTFEFSLSNSKIHATNSEVLSSLEGGSVSHFNVFFHDIGFLWFYKANVE
jgi:hypothetical protein